VWAKSSDAAERGVTLAGAVKRANEFFGTGIKSKQDRDFIKSVVSRLKRPDFDEEIDNRSIESVGWMANELHHRIEAHFQEISAETTVGVFRGWVTSEARRASGIQERFLLVGGRLGKNRLDRRHHAVDAATIAMLRPGAAQVLVIRDNLRNALRITGKSSDGIDWKQYRGADPALFTEWVAQMEALAQLVQQALDDGKVPVFELLRLKLGSSQGHEDTVRPLVLRKVSDELPMELIDRSATPAQWVALTRASGFEPGVGLPADATRTIRINGTHFGPYEEIGFFPTGAGCIAVRGGFAELGAAFHHARIYRCNKKLKSGKVKSFYAMMRVYQVDLLKHAHEDLFSVEILPQAISRRTAEARLRESLNAGEAEYVGWIVPGDELVLNLSSQIGKGQVGELLSAYPDTRNWVVSGFFTETRLRLRPRSLASEGLPEDVEDGVRKIIAGVGWRPSVDVVFGECQASVIRRDVLGRARVCSSKGLPVSWTAKTILNKE
jgi:CRISPR-associated endonuclease Csn1